MLVCCKTDLHEADALPVFVAHDDRHDVRVALDRVQNLDLALHVDHIFGRKQLLLRDHLSIVLTGTAVVGKHCLSHDEPLCGALE